MNKVVLVTGGSRGIGAATAKLAAAQGYYVCINYNTNELAANHLVDEIHANGGRAISVRANVAIESDVLNLFEIIDEKFGQLTALVNNAGVLEKQMRLESIDLERIKRIFSTNVFGSILCAREAVKRMSIKNGGQGGAIVNVSSAASRLGAAGEYVDYASSKGAIDSLTIGLSREVAEEGIRVNAVRPAYIYTEMHSDGGEPERVDRIKESLPMKRGGNPEEVANAIMWLLSDQASYTTGTFIELAGGR